VRRRSAVQADLDTIVEMRQGRVADAETLHALIRAHQIEGHLLPRTLDDVRRRASRFVVAESNEGIVACAELAPLSASVAEVRSLVVRADYRGAGLASQLVDEIARRAAAAGFRALSAFAHDARFFVRQNFSLVPHEWLPEKIARDCASCPLFRRCGQQAMLLPLKEMVGHESNVVEDRRAAVA
jgi:amino-acid N-acetyltransferase